MATAQQIVKSLEPPKEDREDRVMATAQHIVKCLEPPKEDREDMLLAFSSFDNRLSNIGDLIEGSRRLESAENFIFRYNSNSDWQDFPNAFAEFLGAVDEILKLMDDFSIRSNDEIMDRAETAIQVAMSRLEKEFRHLLINNTILLDTNALYGSIRRVLLSFKAIDGEIGQDFKSFVKVSDGSGVFHERGTSLSDDLSVDLINSDAVIELKEIADGMIRSGYERECVQAYCFVRRRTLVESLAILGVEKMSIEEVQRIEWSCLDEKMKNWRQNVKIVVKLLLKAEKKLCDNIFCDSETMNDCLNDIVKGCVRQVLIFAQAVAIGERSSEKLFRILDMYDALAEVLPDLEAIVTDWNVCSEVRGVLNGLGEAAKGTFAEFENAVQRETSKKPMQGGEIHPLTRYVMNYLKLLVDYGETLNKLLESDEIDTSSLQIDAESLESISLITRKLLFVLTCLESNIKEKSRLYDDSGMQYIFLMNNIQYIVQKVKGSELGKLLGDNWVRKRRREVYQYATSYVRASWSKALACFKVEGIGGGSGNASKVTLKERFKSFNLCFEDIYRVQTAWRVPDLQLREELRILISQKVILAYRAFTARFGGQLESGKHAGKYVKYTPEDLESYLTDLFEGSPGELLHHLRRKST